MLGSEEVKVTRDVNAHLVPSGDKITIKKGELVQITQALGGSYTVIIRGNMAQINSENADALGKEKTTPKKAAAIPGDFHEDLVWDQLKTCYDPEIPVNIAELGLIYDCRPYELEDGQWRIEIKMTLTAPGCGMGPSIADEVKSKIESIPGVAEAKVDLVWEPPWNMEMMSEEARLHLGMM